MKLNDCTKAELIEIIKTWIHKVDISFALSNIEIMRSRKRLAEVCEINEQSAVHWKAYLAFLKKYNGVKIVDIPYDEIKKADEHLKAAQKVDKKANRIYEEVHK